MLSGELGPTASPRAREVGGRGLSQGSRRVGWRRAGDQGSTSPGIPRIQSSRDPGWAGGQGETPGFPGVRGVTVLGIRAPSPPHLTPACTPCCLFPADRWRGARGLRAKKRLEQEGEDAPHRSAQRDLRQPRGGQGELQLQGEPGAGRRDWIPHSPGWAQRSVRSWRLPPSQGDVREDAGAPDTCSSQTQLK